MFSFHQKMQLVEDLTMIQKDVEAGMNLSVSTLFIPEFVIPKLVDVLNANMPDLGYTYLIIHTDQSICIMFREMILNLFTQYRYDLIPLLWDWFHKAGIKRFDYSATVLFRVVRRIWFLWNSYSDTKEWVRQMPSCNPSLMNSCRIVECFIRCRSAFKTIETWRFGFSLHDNGMEFPAFSKNIQVGEKDSRLLFLEINMLRFLLLFLSF